MTARPTTMARPPHATPKSDTGEPRGPAGGELAANALLIAALGHDWQTRAACRDADPETFFPRGRTVEDAELALAYCARCPVTEPCLEQGLLEDRNRVGGIYGGTTEAQRLASKRAARNKAKAATARARRAAAS